MARRTAEIDIILSNGQKAGKTINELTKDSTKLAREIKSLKPGSEEFIKKSADFDKVSKRLKTVKGEAFGVSKTMGAMSSQAKALGRTLLAAFGARAIVRAIGGFIKQFKDFQQANANLASVLGKSRKQIKGLTADAKRLGASTAFTAKEVTGLQTEFAKLGFAEQDIINLSDATLDLAAATGTELSEAAKVAGATVRGFGLETEDTTRVIDVMAKSFSSSALDMDKFSTAMSTVAPVAKNANVSMERTTALLGLLVDRGVDASTAGTSLRNIFLELSNQGISFEAAMQKINTATDKNAVALELFGKRGATTAAILADNSEAADTLEGKLNNAGGAAQRMADEQLDTLNGSLTIARSAFEGLLLSVESGDGAFSQFLTGAVKGFTKLVGLISSYVATPLSEELETQRISMLSLGSQVLQLEEGTDEYRKGINQLKKDYPDYLKELDKDKTSHEDLLTALKAGNKALIDKIVIQKLDEKSKEVSVKAAEAEIRLAEKREDLQAKVIAQLAEQGLEEEFLNRTIEEQVAKLEELGIGKDRQISKTGQLRESTNKYAEELKNIAHLEVVSTKATNEAASAQDRLNKIRQQLGLLVETPSGKSAEELAVIAAEEKRKADEKALAGTEKFNERIVEQDQKLASLRLAIIAEGFAKKRAMAEADLEKDLSQIDAEREQILANIDLTEQQKNALIDSLNQQRDLKVQEKKQADAILDEEEKKENFEKLVTDLTEEEAFKTELQEQFFLSQIDTDFNREQARLELQKSFLQKRLDLLIANGMAETAEAAKLKTQLLIIDKDLNEGKLQQETELQQQRDKIKELRVAALTDATDAIINLFGEETTAGKAARIAQKAIAISDIKTSAARAWGAAVDAGNKMQALYPFIPGIGAAYTTVKRIAIAASAANQISQVTKAEKGLAAGKVLRGPSHAGGGIPIEAEGEEIILTKGVWRNPALRQAASNLNVAGGGISFETGGPVNAFANTNTAADSGAQAGNTNAGAGQGINTGAADNSDMIAGKLDEVIMVVKEWPTRLKINNSLQEVKEGIETLQSLEDSGF